MGYTFHIKISQFLGCHLRDHRFTDVNRKDIILNQDRELQCPCCCSGRAMACAISLLACVSVALRKAFTHLIEQMH